MILRERNPRTVLDCAEGEFLPVPDRGTIEHGTALFYRFEARIAAIVGGGSNSRSGAVADILGEHEVSSTFYRVAGHSENQSRADEGGRVATTVTLSVLVVCLLAAKSLVLEAHPPQPAPHDAVTPVRIVDPAFCENQTWPYIDPRCLKRSATPDQPPANTRNADAMPASPAAPAAPAAPPASVAGAETSSHRASDDPVTQPMSQAVTSTGGLQPGSVPSADNSRAAEIRRDDRQANATLSPGEFRPDASKHQRHWGHHPRFLFGFRF